ncbi:MAG: hypothetical protein WB783_00580 [Arenicellales bacterium]
MTFHSILFDEPEAGDRAAAREAPAFFSDLHLDWLVDAITSGREEYDLEPFFRLPLNDVDAIKHRQEVMRDIEDEECSRRLAAFTEGMTLVRRYLALSEKLQYKYHRKGWHLEAAETYCDTVVRLHRDLDPDRLRSRGLLDFCRYLKEHVESNGFATLFRETKKLKSDLAAVKYCILIRDNAVKVRRYEGEVDYSREVEQAFEKFKQGAVKDYRAKLPHGTGMNHVEAQILDLVAKLHPGVFASLDGFCARHEQFRDETIVVFDREIQFYIAYLEHISMMKSSGLSFCYPAVSRQTKEVYSRDGFDLALATKCVNEKTPVVCNDFHLSGRERILVVSGPNQGGKTTFSRTFGQLHYLGCLGLPVPGREAQLFLFDRLFTHFEREEDIRNLRGKLQDDLVRIHDILDQATGDSILIMNEIFSSTTLQDAVYLGGKIMEKIVGLDLLCVWVTFIDEIAAADERVVSMMATVVPDDPASRTFKILRRPADGLAYAMSIAERYRLTYAGVKERMKS